MVFSPFGGSYAAFFFSPSSGHMSVTGSPTARATIFRARVDRNLLLITSESQASDLPSLLAKSRALTPLMIKRAFAVLSG